ncbi:MAG TPA: inositol monophosphatase family protein [Fimbriimonadaceae bacterium]|nr:inositol monophosphatase family protein [Fimbriimonadaceae bacterium]
MSPRLAFAVDAALRAGRSTLAHFQTGAAVDLKSDDSPVTIADRHAERMIREGIERWYPDDAILGEEEGERGESPNRWVIDPIDGTKSFICGVPLYGTLLAYEEAGHPVLGVCYFPALDEMLYAERGAGAFWNGRPCRVSEKFDIKGSVICGGGHRTMADQGRMEPFLDLAELAMATRTWSDAYGHALVATGRVEAMIDPTVQRWDVSAMKVIVEEAGGMMTDFAGGDALHPKANGCLEVVSSNGRVHEELLEAFGR